MNPVLEKILRTKTVETTDGDELDLEANISLDDGLLLQKAIGHLKAVKTLEIGLWHGVSSLFICEAIADRPGAHHIVMDPNQFRDCQGIGLNNIKKAGYESMVEFHCDSSHKVLPQLEEKGIEIDFGFIDGSHMFDYTLLEFFYIDKILRVGGIIAFDDANMPAVRKVCRFISTNRRYEVFDCVPPKVSWQQRFKYGLAKNTCKLLPPLKKVVRPELQTPEIDRGLIPGSKYVAFEKIANDSEETRPWIFYRDF